jgi:hypothetical protein
MADEIDYDKLGESVAKAIAAGGQTVKPDQLKSSMKEMQDLATKVKKGTKDQTEAAEILKKNFAKASEEILKKNKTTVDKQKELDETIKKLAGKNKDLADELTKQAESVKKKVEADKLSTETLKRSEESQKKFNTALDTAKKIFEPFGKAASTVISGYQSSSSQIGMATSIMSAELQLATDGASKAGQGLTTLGAATAGSSSKVGKFGSALATGAGALLKFGASAGELAQKVLPTLTTELNNYISGFQSLSSAGALFTGGLQGMANAGKDAGLNLAQFSNVVKQNQGALAASGLGVGEASKKMGQVLKSGGDGMRKDLLNLGYSYEEQAGLVAETMAQMRQSGGPLKANDKQVAEQTMKYADNLRIIASVTGEDAKKRMAQAQEAANNLAFQQKLDGMSAEQKANTVAAMATMSKEEQKAFMEVAVNGRAMTVESAALMNQVPALGSKINQSVDEFNKGTLDGQKQLQINADNQAAIHKDLMSNTSIAAGGMAGIGGIVGTLNSSMANQLQENNKYTAEGIAAAKKNLEDQKKQGDDTLQGSMNKVIIENQKAMIATQDAILKSGVMKAFADEVAKATSSLTKMIDQFGGSAGSAAGGIVSAIGGVVDKLGGVLAGAGALAEIYSAFKKPPGGGTGASGGGTPKPKGGGGGGRIRSLWESAKAGISNVAQAGANMFAKGAEAAKGAALGVAGAAGGAVAAGESAASGAAGALGGAATKAGESAAAKTAAGAATTAGAKGAASVAAKGIGKSILKKIPLIGLGIGLWDAVGRAQAGDWAGAAMSAASGVASTVPGAGTLVSTAIDAAQIATDATGLTGGDAKDLAPATPSEPKTEIGPTSMMEDQKKALENMTEQQRQQAAEQAAKAVASTDTATKSPADSLADLNGTMQQMLAAMSQQLELMRNVAANTKQTAMNVS